MKKSEFIDQVKRDRKCADCELYKLTECLSTFVIFCYIISFLVLGKFLSNMSCECQSCFYCNDPDKYKLAFLIGLTCVFMLAGCLLNRIIETKFFKRIEPRFKENFITLAEIKILDGQSKGYFVVCGDENVSVGDTLKVKFYQYRFHNLEAFKCIKDEAIVTKLITIEFEPEGRMSKNIDGIKPDDIHGELWLKTTEI